MGLDIVALGKAGKAMQRANQAYNMAVGLVYVANNYSELVTTLNAAAASSYTLGCTIYVKTVNVPDLWFASINEPTSVPYTYVSDAQFVTDLQAAPTGLQIGYYKVCQQEGPKLNFVAFDTAQTLTDAQKKQARSNINACKTEEYNSSATSYDDDTLYYVVED